MQTILESTKLSVKSSQKELLHHIDIELTAGETVVLLGPNGAGKSTFVKSIAGISELKTTGKILFGGQNIARLPAEARAKLGIFLSYQEPVEIAGVTYSEMLRTALEERGKKISLRDFKLQLASNLERLGLEPFACERDLNVGFSGGEKKKMEVLQMLVLEPKLAMFDEIDSGLDVDALKKIAGILADYQQRTKATYLFITHNLRLAKYLPVRKVYVMNVGSIEKVGGSELLDEVNEKGFAK